MKKEIEEEVKTLLEQGMSHQEVFDNLKGKYNTQGKLLTSILCKIPIPQKKEQYKWAWVFLLIFLGGLTCLRILSLLTETSNFARFFYIIFACILIYIIKSVVNYEKYTFQFLGVVGLVNMMWMQRTIGLEKIFQPEHILVTIFIVGMCITSYLLYYKIFVKHSLKKEWYQDAYGNNKLQVVARFKER